MCSFLRRAQQRSPLVLLTPLLASAVRQGSCPLRAGSPPTVVTRLLRPQFFCHLGGRCAGCSRSKGPARARKSPDCAQAGGWSPRESKVLKVGSAPFSLLSSHCNECTQGVFMCDFFTSVLMLKVDRNRPVTSLFIGPGGHPFQSPPNRFSMAR